MHDFYGETFVAYSDISGFKDMMKDTQRGPAALDALYSSGYHVIANQPPNEPPVEGLFVSDCGILFVREGGDVVQRLESLLLAVEQLNRRCFNRAISLTTSVAWGEFSYHQRVEIPGIEKNPIYGNAYVTAFIDNESDSPRIYPNECRIVKQNLPDAAVQIFEERHGRVGSRSRAEDRYYYFEWMRPLGE